MSRIQFKKDGEEHNFWQNYTDLMSGFLIVFIIASLVAINKYGGTQGPKDPDEPQGVDSLRTSNTPNEASGGTQEVDSLILKKIREFQRAEKEIGDKSKCFHYSEEFNRFECKTHVQFDSNERTIEKKYHNDLISAGKELEKIVSDFQKTSEHVAFKIIIDGRAANNKDSKKNNGQPWTKGSAEWDSAEVLSFNRARAVWHLWESNGLFTDASLHKNLEIVISGSGFGGQNRYTDPETLGDDAEARNKTFIIQIIPYIKF